MEWFEADWPAPAGIRACVTTRHAGHSLGPYAAGNLGDHVGDQPAHVQVNRAALLSSLVGVETIQWLRQVHGTQVYSAGVDVGGSSKPSVPEADAIVTAQSRLACAVLTADCLPVCLASTENDRIAVAHAGWRGLAAGVLEETLRSLGGEPAAIVAWLGPAIGPCHFEVGEDVRAAFLTASPEAEATNDIAAAFRPAGQVGKWYADLYQLARYRLQLAGVRQVFGGGLCTVCDEQGRFYSYRRDGQASGRFATLVYRLP